MKGFKHIYFICIAGVLMLLIFFYKMIHKNDSKYTEDEGNFYSASISSKFLVTCTPSNSEWEMLNEHFLIRRNAVVYLYDEAQIKMIAVSEKTFETELLLSFQVFDVNRNFYKFLNLSQYNKEKVIWTDAFPFNEFSVSVNFQLDLVKHFEKLSDVRIQMTLFDLRNNQSTKCPLDVVIKSKKERKAHGTAICSRNIFLKEQDFENFRWWVEINKFLGYKKIVVSNSSVPDSKKFKEYFHKNKGILELASYLSVPYFNETSKSFTFISFEEVPGGFWTFMHESIPYNECFLRLFADYERIAVHDIDEIIVPVRDSDRLKLTEITNELITDKQKCDFDLENYMSELNFENPKKLRHLATSFKHRMSIENSFAKEIFKKISDFISSIPVFNSSFNVSVIYAPIKKNYTFKIINQEQFTYAKVLLNVYRLYEKQTKKLEKYDDNLFNRFFLLDGPLNVKTVYQLDRHEIVSHHRLYGHHRNFEWYAPIDKGYAGHYRPVLHLDRFMHDVSLSIMDLKFDTFYLNCVLMKINDILE